MLINLVAGIVAATLALQAPISRASSTKTDCLNGKRKVLETGGFSGPLLCNREGVSFRFVGTILGKHQNFLLYDYRYKFMPEHGSVVHGGQRLVVLSSKGSYVGQYSLSPLLDIVIKDSSVTVNLGGDVKGAIEFEDGPPSTAYVDGEIVTFFK